MKCTFLKNGSMYCSTKEIKVIGAAGTGTLRVKSKAKLVCEVRATNNGTYELTAEKGKSYVVNYRE